MGATKGGLRWDCEKSGCYCKACLPLFGDLNTAFDGRIAFSDIDAVVEKNNHFLFLEWKTTEKEPRMSEGQNRLYLALSSLKDTTVVVVSGSPGQGPVHGVMVYSKGKRGTWGPTDRRGLRLRISAWYSRAKSNRSTT